MSFNYCCRTWMDQCWSMMIGLIFGAPTSRKAYLYLSGTIPASPLFKWIWKSSILPKHKFFFWLLLQERQNTRNLLIRKNMFLDSYCCPVCIENEEETLQHLFFDCSFSQACWIFPWHFLGHYWGCHLRYVSKSSQATQQTSK
jgi:hypothetical protein